MKGRGAVSPEQFGREVRERADHQAAEAASPRTADDLD